MRLLRCGLCKAAAARRQYCFAALLLLQQQQQLRECVLLRVTNGRRLRRGIVSLLCRGAPVRLLLRPRH